MQIKNLKLVPTNTELFNIQFKTCFIDCFLSSMDYPDFSPLSLKKYKQTKEIELLKEHLQYYGSLMKSLLSTKIKGKNVKISIKYNFAREITP